jgi:alkylation response protein AidB-like acyl-CoA dehydrogenase
VGTKRPAQMKRVAADWNLRREDGRLRPPAAALLARSDVIESHEETSEIQKLVIARALLREAMRDICWLREHRRAT